jgi:hypothetical protein
MEASHGGRRTEWEEVTVPLFFFIGINTSRPSLDQGLRLEDTLSVMSFIKEPLHFCELKPAVLSVIQEIRLLVLKTYFFPVNQKYVIWYLQFCH